VQQLTTTDWMFLALAVVAVAGALGVALLRHILYAALSLMVALAGVAGLFVVLSADFVAGVQLLVYVGGILVLTLFAIMLTQGIEDVRTSNRAVGRPAAAMIVGVFFVVAARAILMAEWPSPVLEAPAPSTGSVGHALLGTWVLPFELASVVLLIVLVGAVVLSRKEAVE
jgi:NADH:ubiquinone oxidoreductase subunit 6 (subunit J)